MSDCFGVRTGRLTQAQIKVRMRVAKRHGCRHYYMLDGNTYRSWFATRSEGEPFDGATARAVLADLRAELGEPADD
jgi:hypothetical protein